MAHVGIGSRVVVRYRIVPEPTSGPHLSDAVGEITAIDPDSVVIATRRGPITVPREAIVTAKAVPPPPRRRNS